VRVTSSLAKTHEPYRISIIEDITERKELQAKVEEYTKHLETLVEEKTKQLKDAERLAAIGQTAGMVGHDIRNPLQSIIGNVYLAQKDSTSLPNSEEKESLQESLEAIGKQTEYINKIVLDLQDFAKPLNPLAEETDLKRLIEELLVRNEVPENIQTDAKVDPDVEKVIADSAYMKRILGNLISNAVQAMPNGGKLGIHAYREAEDIVVTVEDTGTGVPEEAKPKLFQPLFTTKSKGQGFGLAVVKRLTEALNGTITFESQEGKGTKFTLRFPYQRVDSFPRGPR
jgi:signal transduction histidine kinase